MTSRCLDRPTERKALEPSAPNRLILSLQERVLKALSLIDCRGKEVRDIARRDGLVWFEAEKLGAREVIGIDSGLSVGAVEVLIPHFQSSVKLHEMNLPDLRPDCGSCPGCELMCLGCSAPSGNSLKGTASSTLRSSRCPMRLPPTEAYRRSTACGEPGGKTSGRLLSSWLSLGRRQTPAA